MSTKSIAILDASELKDGQMKEVEFGEGKVLLLKLGDKVNATSAWCTHYGAPLVKGALMDDGPVIWHNALAFLIIPDLLILPPGPWHGACFNVYIGDIEDTVAPNALHVFKAEIQDGKIGSPQTWGRRPR
ncbi:hypothetical protein FRC06_004528 [Ceratobasidium sp. 370]|nr:hypothetical protein FRC06_004528 [Ceratobasidium sp. 370]